MKNKILKYGSIKEFYFLTKKITKLLTPLFIALLAYGIVYGIILSPTDYQQKYTFKIIYVHVPSAFLSLSIFLVMGIMSLKYIIWDIKITYIIAKSSAPIGAVFTFITLVTGSIWGKPMWGTWWVWDARLTSELILLLIYLGYMGLYKSINNKILASKLISIFNIIGMVNIPIIHYSVEWWHTLHQGSTLSKFSYPNIENEMLFPLIAMILAFLFLSLILTLLSVQTKILWIKKKSNWVQNEI